MMIDVSKIKVGDEVTVRFHVGDPQTTYFGIPTVQVTAIDGTKIFVQHHNIATHTPAPRAFKPGDRVTWGISEPVAFEVLAVRNGEAAIWNKDGGMAVERISILRHADESE